MVEIKKRCKDNMYFLFLVLISSLLIICTSALAQGPPIPRTVEGRVFANSTNGVQNGVSVRINSTTTLDSVVAYTDAPDVPDLLGSYSLNIRASNGETIVGWSWNSTHYGTNATTIQGGTTNLNFILNITRPSEANVTILAPQNNTPKNKTIIFNITANVSMLGSNGDDCNATIKFFGNTTLNITTGENLTHFLGDIPLFGHNVTIWSVVGLNDGVANVTIRADCASDGIKLDKKNSKKLFNITISNQPPSITRIAVDNPIDLLPGDNQTIWCNATIYEPNTPSDLKIVNATLFQSPVGNDAQDDKNHHYTNSTCLNYSSSTFESNYTCGFKVAYFANNGTWYCNISVSDYSNVSNYTNKTFQVNELLAIEVSSPIIDFGDLQVTEISSADVEVQVKNIGNMPINATIRSFAPNQSMAYLNLSMTCPKGNISNNNTRFSQTSGNLFSSMQPMNNVSRMLNFTLHQRTNDVDYGNDTNSTFWKIQIPPLTLGLCNGTVIFGAVTT